MTERLYGKLSRRPWNQFHLQQNTTPDRLRMVFDLGWNQASLTFGSEGTVNLIRGFLRGLDILQEDGTFTPQGERLAKLHRNKPELLCNAVHIWLRCFGTNGFPPRFALSYDAVCNILFGLTNSLQEVIIDRDDFLTASRAVIRGRTGFTDAQIAFSLDSIRAIVYWLGSLEGDPIRLVRSDYIVNRRSMVNIQEVYWIRGFFAQHHDLPMNDEPVCDFLSRILFSTPDAVAVALNQLNRRLINNDVNAFLIRADLPAVQIGDWH